MTTAHEGDLVLGALGSMGTPVDCCRPQPLDLEGPQVLWLVAAGAVDLFAVDAETAGPLAPPRAAWRRARCCSARSRDRSTPWWPGRCGTAWCTASACASCTSPPTPRPGPTTSTATPSTCRRRRARWSTPSPSASAAACPSSSRRRWPTERAAAPTDDDVFWMQVPPGSVQYGSLYGAEAAADLLMDPAVWQSMVDQQYRLLTTLDRWIEQLERTHETRTAAGIKAGEAVRAQADQTLLASIGKSSAAHDGRRRRRQYAACKLVAEAAGIPLAEPAQSGTESDRLDPVERDRPRLPGPHPGRTAGRPLVAGQRRPAGGPPGPVRCAGGAAVAARRLCGRASGDRPRDADREGERGGVRAARGDVLPSAARTAAQPARPAPLQHARHRRRSDEPADQRSGDGGHRGVGADRDRQGAR